MVRCELDLKMPQRASCCPVAENLIDLKLAIDAEDDTKFEALKKVIVDRVGKAVESAIRDKISLVDIILSTFNFDDKMTVTSFLKISSKLFPMSTPPSLSRWPLEQGSRIIT